MWGRGWWAALVVLGCLSLGGTPANAALETGYEYYADPAPSQVEEVINSILASSGLNARFESARETPEGFLVVLHHNTCIDAASLNDVLAEVIIVLDEAGLIVESVQTSEQENLDDTDTIVINVQASELDPFLAIGDDANYFDSCFSFLTPAKKKGPIQELYECCYSNWQQCDGTYGLTRCLACGGRQVGGLCVVTLQAS